MKKIMGVRAEVTCLARFLHPSAYIRERYVNQEHRQRLSGMTVVRRESKTINRKPQMAIVVTHEEFPNKELYAVEKHFMITKEGPVEYFFEVDNEAGRKEMEQTAVKLPKAALDSVGNDPRLVDELRGVVDVDDDNDPAPENIPDVGKDSEDNSGVFNEWGHNGICYRKEQSAVNAAPKLKGTAWTDTILMIGMVWQHLFPMHWLTTVLLEETRKKMLEEGSKEELTLGELLRFIGLWFLMATTHFGERTDFFRANNPNPFDGAPF